MFVVSAYTDQDNNNTDGNQKAGSNFQTIAEEELSPADGSDKQAGPWKMQQTVDSAEGTDAPEVPDKQPAATAPEPAQAPPAQASSAAAAAPTKYVPPRMRNRTAEAASPGANSMMSRPIQGSQKVSTAPPDVKSQSDFPTLSASSGEQVNSNPWQQRAQQTVNSTN